MTNFTTRMMIAAATLVVAAGSASAQYLKADIPFTFRAGDATMAAGTYQVKTTTLTGGHPVYQIRSADGARSVLLMANSQVDPKKEWASRGEAVLSFDCGTGRCALTEVWNGSERFANAVPHPKLSRDETTRAAVVVMRQDKGE